MSGLDIVIAVDRNQVEHVNRLLAAVPQKAERVYIRAFDRGLKAARSQSSTEIRKRYAISEKNVERYRNIRTRIVGETDGVVGQILFSGRKIPLFKFDPRPAHRQYTSRYVNGKAGWRVTGKVGVYEVRGQKKDLRRGFIATFPSGHEGFFYRTGGKNGRGNNKIAEYYGFSVADMLDYQPAREAIQARAAEIVRKTVDHELLRALE